MSDVVSPSRIAAGLTELWSPRVIAELDDSFVKVAKVHGSLTWHSHDEEDELFYILKGSLTIEMEQRTVVLREGEAFVVPKGVRHNPIAEHECHILLIERKTTLHTGREVTDKTRPAPPTLARGFNTTERSVRLQPDRSSLQPVELMPDPTRVRHST
jgi:mannose-6-phosphate isomerase-like protein (cupin superfamily)